MRLSELENGPGHPRLARAVKRLIDVTLASVLLVVAVPFLLVVALLVWIGLGRPILFVQERPGLHGRIFRLYKFRTMRHLLDASGRPLSDEERLTALGRFLRRSSLDELPQLFNVLAGTMSMVGPRPLLTQYLPLYSVAQYRRHEMKPGITGWAQISGRNDLTWEEKFRLDVLYVDRWTLLIDLKILLVTAVRVLRASGVTQCGHATVEYFRGNEPESPRVTPASGA
jgi:lipopolysaccharide/colanic/teichoic acid biosynthesis glycosyltransferase